MLGRGLVEAELRDISEIVIGFRATPNIISSALIFSAIMGLLGGLVPAIRASLVSPVEAMRA